ncbi:MAG: glycosyltransferase [Actinomycetota bacterium]
MTIYDTTSTSAPFPAGAGDGFVPATVLDVELSEPLQGIRCDGQHRRVWVVGRLYSEPLGICVLRLGPDGVAPGQLAAMLWPGFREAVCARFNAAGLPPPAALTGAGLRGDRARWPFLVRRRAVLDSPPFISVVICTRDRPGQLAACLRRLGELQYPRYEVVVVDNAADDAVRAMVEASQGVPGLRYVAEPRAGLSWARNAGTVAAAGEIIAFLDDDEEPDKYWLAGLACGFSQADDIGCVSGMVVPARIDTPAQELFEQVGGHCKGRGFYPAVFSRHGPQNPLYPLPPFGVGANMAFRREALARIGGFDVALGAGTPACAGEDTLALTLVLLSGYRIAYEPAALMRHHHRTDLDSLGSQLQGYGTGLTAYYAALLRKRPATLPALLRLLPAAAGYLRRRDAGSAGLPPGLSRRQRWGMLTGPAAYLRSVGRQARAGGRRRSC